MKFLFVGLIKKLLWKVGICASFTIKFLLNVFGLGFNSSKKTDDLNQDFTQDFKDVFEVPSTYQEKAHNEQPQQSQQSQPQQTNQEPLKQLVDDYDVVSIEEIERIDQLV